MTISVIGFVLYINSNTNNTINSNKESMVFIPKIWLSIINTEVVMRIIANNSLYVNLYDLSDTLGIYEKSLYLDIIRKIILNNNEKFMKFTKYLNAIRCKSIVLG
ncbi:MAG: hypothetical protein UHX91_07225 [Methanosphaera sp.]|nr:hypothetical protein [Methanosphaera sp.]